MGSPPGLDKAIAAKQKHADRLLDKPGVAGVAVTLNDAGKPVIRIYKERDDVEDLPHELEGVPVDSITTGVLEPYDHAPTHRFPRPVPIGISAGLAGFATGTLGVRVTNGTNVYALSNNHVFAGINTANIGDPIISPGDADGGSDPGDRIGTLAAYQEIDFNGGTNTMDAAIALTSAANVGTATPADGYGNPSNVTTAASVGLPVQKYGRTTGFQQGSVAGTNVSVDVCYIAFGEFCVQEARFEGQISVSPGTFAAPGDSGSLIVTQGGNQPVALLFAGGDGLTIGTPIDLVLQRFGVTIDGLPPGPGPPGAPTGLSALAGDASVSLSWTAPSFDGGSQVTGYRIYRGVSPNPTSALSDVLQTSYVDESAANGTTYYYKVSALNANGEGALSNQASATPAPLVAPAEPVVALDAFNRADENPLSDAGRWSNAIIAGESGHYVTSNMLACSVTTTCTSWRNNAQYGVDAEAWARLSVLPGTNNQLRLYVRLQHPAVNAYVLRTSQLTGTDEVYLDRFDNGAATRLLTLQQELSAGDMLLLRATGQTIEAWRQPSGGGWSRLGTVRDATYGAAGYVGVGLRGQTGRVDDFGARGLGTSSPPGAPAGLSAVAGDAQVSLAWAAPVFDGGSAITGYKVYRGTSPGPTTAVATLGVQTSYTDTALTNGQIYYYRVAAVNGSGEGPPSNQASATPVALVTPATPLAIVDSFNRPNENPLSDAGRWSNAIIGGESGHYVTSNLLACSVTTTCTARRNDAQYGPDVEVYARLSTLPGTNNQLRLYARLQVPSLNGYLLRTSHLSGTDEVWIERFDGGAATRLLTIPQELTAGDVILLRVRGTSVEAWRHNGSAWSRLGVVQDATYAAAGWTGIGLRGTTGRIDDFGARTLGGPPPDTEPPTAPGTLTAGATSSSEIDLSWAAATDDSGVVSQYRIERCEGAGCSNFAEIATTAATGFQNIGLSAATSYSYRVRAEDGATPPNQGPYGNAASATTPAPPDTEPPSAPGTLSASAFSDGQIELTWGPATDNSGGVVLYRIERCQGAGCTDFAEVALATSTTHMDVGLSESTSYSYRVRAEDGATPPNVGPYSNTASATTPAAPDTEPPTAPANLGATATSPTQIDLSWEPATDNVAVVLYRVERCQGPGCSDFTEIGTTASASFASTGLTPSTSYAYRIRAQDAVPNTGGYSNTATATTLTDVVSPVEPLPTIDSFNRRNENPLGGGWSNGIGGSAETGLKVQSNVLACTKTTTCTASRNEAFGADVEVWSRVTTLPGANNQFRLYARLQNPGGPAHSGYVLRTSQLTGTDEVRLERIDAGATVTRLTIMQELAVGDTLLLRVNGSKLEAWLKRGSAWSLLGSVVDSTYGAAGRVGVGIRGKIGRLDDFGAR